MPIRLLLLVLTLLSFVRPLQAQVRLSGTKNFASAPLTSTGRFEQVSWEIWYKVEVRGTKAALVFYNPKVTVLASSGYLSSDKVMYTPAMLGLASWPTLTQRPCNVHVQVQVSQDGRLSDAYSNCNCDGSCPGGRTFDLSNGAGRPRVVNVVGMNYNDTPDDVVDRLIEAKKRGMSGSAKAPAAGSDGTSLPTAQRSTAPAAYNGVQTAVAVGNVAVPLLGQVVENAGRKQKQVLRELDEQIAREDAVKHADEKQRFQELYQAYLIKADQKGDEDAQMILYFASEALRTQNFEEGFAAKRKRWFEEAVANNNPDALVAKAEMSAGRQYEALETMLPYLEAAAARGSADALCILGNYYDLVPVAATRSGHYSPGFGGNDPVKALDSFRKAAALGSPAALYKLGIIYRYVTYPVKLISRYHVSYKALVGLDEKQAFEYFTKSIQPNYSASLYARLFHGSLFRGSYFNSLSYSELANFYKEGKVVAKNKQTEQELMQKMLDYDTNHPVLLSGSF